MEWVEKSGTEKKKRKQEQEHAPCAKAKKIVADVIVEISFSFHVIEGNTYITYANWFFDLWQPPILVYFAFFAQVWPLSSPFFFLLFFILLFFFLLSGCFEYDPNLLEDIRITIIHKIAFLMILPSKIDLKMTWEQLQFVHMHDIVKRTKFQIKSEAPFVIIVWQSNEKKTTIFRKII